MNIIEAREGVNESSLTDQKAIREEEAEEIHIKLQRYEREAREGKYLIDFEFGNNAIST